MSSPKRKNISEPRERKRSKSPKRTNTFDKMLQSLDDLMVLETENQAMNTETNNSETRGKLQVEQRSVLDVQPTPWPIAKRRQSARLEKLATQTTDLIPKKVLMEPDLLIHESELDENELAELERSRLQLKIFMKEKRDADKKELQMIANNREKRALLERIKTSSKDAPGQSKSSGSPEVLLLMQDFAGDLDDEGALPYDFIKGVMKVLQDDGVVTPVPSNFLDVDGYKDWKSTMGKSLQQVLIKLLKYRFISPPAEVPKGGDVELQICIFEAENIVSKDGRMRGSYCRVEIGEIQPQTAKMKKVRKTFETEDINSLNPFWDQFVTVQVKNISECLAVEVKDKFKPDHFLGRTVIPLHEIIRVVANDGRYEEWHDLVGRGSKKDKYVGGRVRVGAFINNDENGGTVSYSKIMNGVEALGLDNRALFDVLVRACVTLGVHLPRNGRNELLTQESAILLQIWSKTWKITKSYKLIGYLKVLFSLYDDMVGVFDLLVVFHCLYSYIKNANEVTVEEMEIVMHLLEDMRAKFCTAVINYKEFFPGNQPPKALESAILILRMIHKFPMFLDRHPSMKQSPKDELRMMLTEAMISKFQRYKELTAPLDENNVEMVIEAICKLAELINNEIQQDFDHYQSAFNQELDIVRLTAECLLKYFALALEDSGEVLSTDVAVLNASAHVFALYRTIRVMSARYDNFGLSSMSIGYIEGWFTPFMHKWLNNLSLTTAKWVKSAVEQDSFVPISNQDNCEISHSSSISDIFTAIYTQLEFISDLKWSDAVQNAQFLQLFAKVFHSNQTLNTAIEAYCDALTASEKSSLYPSKVGLITNIMTGNPALELEDISTEMFVKMHNVQFAVEKLKEMYLLMNVKKINQTLLKHVEEVEELNAVGKKRSTLRGQFKFQVVCAENLRPTNKSGSSDPFVVIRVPEETRVPPLEKVIREDNQTQKDRSINNPSEEIILRGNDCVLFKSRHISNTLNPIWEETFTAMIPPVERLEVATFTKNLITADEISGAGAIDFTDRSQLKQRLFDNQTHEVMVKLQPQGTLLLRITMFGQNEDIEYWFKRTFQHLDRTQDTLIRQMTRKIDSLIAQTISKAVKDDGIATASTAGSFFKQFSNTPTKNSEITANGLSVHEPADENDAIAALEPLIDYLEKNFASICSNLEPEHARKVIAKLWDNAVTLCTSEMVPPLFGPFIQKKLYIRQASICQWCLELLREFFHGDGGEFGLPFTTLDSPGYTALQELFMFYHESPTAIKEEFQKSISSGQDKTLLLRLIRLYGESELSYFEDALSKRLKVMQ